MEYITNNLSKIIIAGKQFREENNRRMNLLKNNPKEFEKLLIETEKILLKIK